MAKSVIQTRAQAKKNPNVKPNPVQRQRTNFQEFTQTESKHLTVLTSTFVKLSDFKVDSIVLAKQKYSIPWPARILKIEQNRILVYFFGDKRSGYVCQSEIYDFILSINAIKSKILSKKLPRGYRTGICEIEIFMGIPSEKSLFKEL